MSMRTALELKTPNPHAIISLEWVDDDSTILRACYRDETTDEGGEKLTITGASDEVLKRVATWLEEME